MPFNDNPPCRRCGMPFTKRMVEQRHCTNADRGHPELYRGDDSGCFEKTDRGQRVLAALEKQERRKAAKRDRLWRQRKKVEIALARVDQARRQLAELEAAGEAGPDRRSRGQSGPAKNVQGPDGKFVRTTPLVEPKPEKPREKRTAWFQCGNRPCIGRMSHPCDGCGIAESPQEAPESPQNGSADRMTRTSTEPERTVKENPSEPPESPVSASQNPTPETPEEPASRAGRGRRPHRTGSPRYSEGDRDQAVLRLVADVKEEREKLEDGEDAEESLIETTNNPLLED